MEKFKRTRVVGYRFESCSAHKQDDSAYSFLDGSVVLPLHYFSAGLVRLGPKYIG